MSRRFECIKVYEIESTIEMGFYTIYEIPHCKVTFVSYVDIHNVAASHVYLRDRGRDT